MLHSLAENIACSFVKNKQAKAEEQEIYAYGMEFILSTLLNVSSILVVSIFIGKFFESVFFLLAFIFLRKKIGGYHSSTHFRCYLTFLSVYILNMIAVTLIQNANAVYMPIVLSLACAVLVFIQGPIDHENRPFTRKEYSDFKIQSRFIVAFYFYIVLGGMIFCKDQIAIFASISSGSLSAALSVTAAKIKGGR